MFENLVFHGRIYVIFISAFLPASEDLDVFFSWIQLLILYLYILQGCIYLLDCTRRDSCCNGIFSLSCFSLVRSRCLFCAALCTLNCVEYHECALCIIDVGLHAVRCIMHPSRVRVS